MKPDGSGQCSVGIPGNEFAGFSHDLSRVAVADQGTLGSGHPDTYLSVSPLKGLHLTRIWTMGDDLTCIPTWSPSGKSLAFGLVPTEENGASAANPVAQGLWTIGSDGRNRRLLVPGRDIGPVVWSPNGATLAFITTDHQGQSELATIPSGGGKVSVIASLEGINDFINDSIAWSPSGKYIVLAYRIQNLHPGPFQPQPSGIDRYTAAGGKPQTVVAEQTTRSFTGVAYSPDGTQLMVSGSGLLASAGTTTVSTVPGRSATTPLNGAAPQGNNYFLETMNADGSKAKLVASFGSSPQLVGWFRS